jgi:hypothetical protein
MHTFPGAWDDELVVSGVEVGDIRLVDGIIQVPITNLAGHRFPSGEPARALIIEATVYDAAGELLEQLESRIERRVKLPVGAELGDNTLAPAAMRIVLIPVSVEHVQKAVRVTVQVDFDRLANLPVEINLHGSNRRINLASGETSEEPL